MTPRRIQRKRTKGWRLPPGTVVVSRPTKWGNPFTPGQEIVRECMEPGGGQKSVYVANAEQAVCAYRRFLSQRLRIEAKLELRDKDLACWCPLDSACHADVLLRIANS